MAKAHTVSFVKERISMANACRLVMCITDGVVKGDHLKEETRKDLLETLDELECELSYLENGLSSLGKFNVVWCYGVLGRANARLLELHGVSQQDRDLQRMSTPWEAVQEYLSEVASVVMCLKFLPTIEIDSCLGLLNHCKIWFSVDSLAEKEPVWFALHQVCESVLVTYKSLRERGGVSEGKERQALQSAAFKWGVLQGMGGTVQSAQNDEGADVPRKMGLWFIAEMTSPQSLLLDLTVSE